MLRSETQIFEYVVEEFPASHCPFGLFILGFHLPDHLVENTERFESIYSTDAKPFEHFKVLIKRSYRMTSRRMSTQLQKTLESTGSIVQDMQRVKDNGEVA